MKKILAILSLVFVLSVCNGQHVCKNVVENKITYYAISYESYVKLTQVIDSSIVVEPLLEEKHGIEFWTEVLGEKKFKTILEALEWFSNFDFKPEEITYDEFEEKVTIILHRCIEDTWVVNSKK